VSAGTAHRRSGLAEPAAARAVEERRPRPGRGPGTGTIVLMISRDTVSLLLWTSVTDGVY